MEAHLQRYIEGLIPHFFALLDDGWTYGQLTDLLVADSVSNSASVVWRAWVGVMIAHWTDVRTTPALSYTGSAAASSAQPAAPSSSTAYAQAPRSSSPWPNREVPAHPSPPAKDGPVSQGQKS
eukprot:6272824-Heterocapsa_arctica.AAC.1